MQELHKVSSVHFIPLQPPYKRVDVAVYQTPSPTREVAVIEAQSLPVPRFVVQVAHARHGALGLGVSRPSKEIFHLLLGREMNTHALPIEPLLRPSSFSGFDVSSVLRLRHGRCYTINVLPRTATPLTAS